MDTGVRILNQHDLDRIRGFLSLATEGGTSKFRTLLSLKKDLVTATKLEPHEIPPDVVTMNSEVRLGGGSIAGSTVVKVVFPQDAGMGEGNVSLLAPLGAALLGHKNGDTVTYSAPGGEIEVKILEIVYQPESSGDYTS
ncbi:MAG: GreA/GreB family elongation factor [Alkalispirochaeta sp.]|jgi:regulator of nucleoside diphosphate kinase